MILTSIPYPTPTGGADWGRRVSTTTTTHLQLLLILPTLPYPTLSNPTLPYYYYKNLTLPYYYYKNPTLPYSNYYYNYYYYYINAIMLTQNI